MPNPASDTLIEPVAALAVVAAKYPVGGQVSLTALGEGLVAHILGYNSSQAAFARLQKYAAAHQLSLRETSVDQWFLVGEKPYDFAAFTKLAQDLQPDFMVSEQSAGRVRLRLEGAAAPHILNKGIALDFSLSAFPVGKSAPTLCGHIGVHVTRLGEHLFELMVLRSFAVDLWEQLAHMCAPHQG